MTSASQSGDLLDKADDQLFVDRHSTMARSRRVAERGGPVKAGPFPAKASNGLRARGDQRPLGRPPPLAGSRRGFRSFAAGPLVQRGAAPHSAFHFRGALSNRAVALRVLVALETACVTK